MKVWAILWSDGFECSDMLVEVWATEADADRRATELTTKYPSQYNEYYVRECEVK
jgi:hypothetical protein